MACRHHAGYMRLNRLSGLRAASSLRLSPARIKGFAMRDKVQCLSEALNRFNVKKASLHDELTPDRGTAAANRLRNVGPMGSDVSLYDRAQSSLFARRCAVAALEN